jgi:arabinose-5-phosphate isomerase
MEIKAALKQKVILAGVGKNYSLAQLVSEFFLPYNIIAVPLDANHSMHGSLGIIREDDVLITSSKSGDTRELLEMMESLKGKIPEFKNSFLITSNINAKCLPYFKHTLVVSALSESSLYGLSPQSTIMQYLKVYFQILNVINLDSPCTKNDYLLNHQGGSIGKTRRI